MFNCLKNLYITTFSRDYSFDFTCFLKNFLVVEIRLPYAIIMGFWTMDTLFFNMIKWSIW